MKAIIYWCSPFFVGVTYGLIAGYSGVFLGRLFDFGYSDIQEKIAIYGFVSLGICFALVDIVSRIRDIRKLRNKPSNSRYP